MYQLISDRWNFHSYSMLILLVLSFLCLKTESFNVDTVNYVSYSGARHSMFGFSVALHKESGQSSALVGAPLGDANQTRVDRGGAVFRCNVGRDDDCSLVYFDREGNKNTAKGEMDQKSGQWFGATLTSVGEDGPVVACAPRYVFKANTKSSKEEKLDPVGTCYVARNHFRDIVELSPCRTTNWGYHRQGSCQAGFGAAISKNGDRVFIGAPGSWYWQGQAYSVKSDLRLIYSVPSGMDFGYVDERGQVHLDSIGQSKKVAATGPSAATDDNSYLGYSMAAGDFTGQGEQGVAVGMPNGNGLEGKVVLYTSNLENIRNVTGDQLGAYFGYSVCVSDVDGDRLDDLIVGAPMYTDLKNNQGEFETGQIYIFYQKGQNPFGSVDTRADAKVSRARFGMSLANLGDINLDKYGDFAVGAPYDGPNGRGAVYIYHGSSTGVRKKYSQVIFAEDIDPFVSTFGFSLSGAVDIDDNRYPDMSVGAYQSDKAFLFRSRPVVDLDATITFEQISKIISLDEKNCSLKNGVRVPCVRMHSCLTYNGIGVVDTLQFDISYVLDSKKLRTPRMYFLNDERRNILNKTLYLTKTVRFCEDMPVYIKDNIRDKLTPLEVEMRYNLHGLEGYGGSVSTGRTRQRRNALPPVLNHDRGLVQRDSLNIQKNCGPDNVCIPDLRLNTTPSVSKYLLGSKERLAIEVLVQNHGEDAFESSFYMQMPPGVDFKKIERIDNYEKDIPITCSPPKITNNNTLVCDIGNPLPHSKFVKFKVLLDPYHKAGMNASYDFYMHTNSTNPEKNNTVKDNRMEKSIPIWLQTNLTIVGTSLPPDLHYNNSLYTAENITHESELGPQVSHIYNIRNNGPSTIEQAELFLVWPTKTLAEEDLFYMLEQPELSGNIYCSPMQDVNPMGLILDKRKSILESSGVVVQSAAKSDLHLEVPGALDLGSRFGTAAASVSGSGVGKPSGSSGQLTEEERRLLEEAAFSGDASLIHLQRNKDAKKQEEEARTHGVLTSGSTSTSTGAKHKDHYSGLWGKDRVLKFEKEDAVITNLDYDRQIEIQNLGRYLDAGAKISNDEFTKRLDEYTTNNIYKEEDRRFLRIWEPHLEHYLLDGRNMGEDEFRRRISEYADRLAPLPKLNPSLESQLNDLKNYITEGREIGQDEYKKRINEYTSRYLPSGMTGSLDNWRKDIGKYLEDGRVISKTEYHRRLLEYIIRLQSPQKSYTEMKKPAYLNQNIASYLSEGEKLSEEEYHKRLNNYADYLRSSGQLNKKFGTTNIGTYLDEGRKISLREYYRRLQECANGQQTDSGRPSQIPEEKIDVTTTASRYTINGRRVSKEEYQRYLSDIADRLKSSERWNDRYDNNFATLGAYLEDGMRYSEDEYYRRLQDYLSRNPQVISTTHVSQSPSIVSQNITYTFNGQHVSEKEFRQKLNAFADELRANGQWNQRYDTYQNLGAYLDEGRRESEAEYYRRLQNFANRHGSNYGQQRIFTYRVNGREVSKEQYHRLLDQYVDQLRSSGHLKQAFDANHQDLEQYLEEGRRHSTDEYYSRIQEFLSRSRAPISGSTNVRFTEIDMDDIGKYLENGRELGVGEYHNRLNAYARMLDTSGELNKPFDSRHRNLGHYLEEGRKINEAEYYRRLQEYANQQQSIVTSDVNQIRDMSYNDIKRYIDEGRRVSDHEYHKRLSAYAHLLQLRGDYNKAFDSSSSHIGRYLEEGRRISENEYYNRLEHVLRQQQSQIEVSTPSHISTIDSRDIIKYLNEGRRRGKEEYRRRLAEYAQRVQDSSSANRSYFEEARRLGQDEYYRRIQEYANQQQNVNVESSSVSHVSGLDLDNINVYLDEGRRIGQQEYHKRLAEYARILHATGALSGKYDNQHPNLGRYLDDGRRISEEEYYQRLQSFANQHSSRAETSVSHISHINNKDILSYFEEGRTLGSQEYRKRMLEYANKIQESGELNQNQEIAKYLTQGRNISEQEYFRRLLEYARRVQSRFDSSTVASYTHADRNNDQFITFIEEGRRISQDEFRKRLYEYARRLQESGDLSKNVAMNRYLENGRSISDDEYYRRLQEYASRNQITETHSVQHQISDEEYRRRLEQQSRHYQSSSESSVHAGRDWSTEITINPELINSGGAASRYGSLYNKTIHRGGEYSRSTVRYGSSGHISEEESRRHGGINFRQESGFGAVALGPADSLHSSALDSGEHGSRQHSSHRSYEENDRDLGADLDEDYDYNDYNSHVPGEGITATYEHPYESSSHAHREVHKNRDGHQIKYYDRFKRQAQNSIDFDIENAITCNATKCAVMRCIVGPLPTDTDTWIAFRSRLNAQTLKKIGSNRNVVLSSLMVAHVTKLPSIGVPKVSELISREVNTTVAPSDPYIKPDIVPLWVVVLSAVAGTIILLLLIYLLYKCGFFKRNRPSSSPERQPLNRNGTYHGDEQL